MSETVESAEAQGVEAEQGEGSARRETIRRIVQGDLASLRVVIGLALIWIIFQFENERFLSAENLTNLGAADHGGRADLGRDRLRAAAGRDRPLGRRRQRPRRRGDGGPERQARLEPLPGDRRGGRRRAGDRPPPGLPLQPLRGSLLRRHPGGITGLAGGAAAGAGRDRLDQPQRPEDHRPRQHLLLGRRRLDLRRDRRSPATGRCWRPATNAAATPASPPRTRPR